MLNNNLKKFCATLILYALNKDLKDLCYNLSLTALNTILIFSVYTLRSYKEAISTF